MASRSSYSDDVEEIIIVDEKARTEQEVNVSDLQREFKDKIKEKKKRPSRDVPESVQHGNVTVDGSLDIQGGHGCKPRLGARNSFEEQARVSKMLLNIPYSSDDEDDKSVSERCPEYSGSVQPIVQDETGYYGTTANQRDAENARHITMDMSNIGTATLNRMKNRPQGKQPTLKYKTRKRIEKRINNLHARDTINTFYLTLVKHRRTLEVEALFCYAKEKRRQDFDKNTSTADDKTALTIALDNKDIAMLEVLLKYQVELGKSIDHAITVKFTDGLELLLAFVPEGMDEPEVKKERQEKLGKSVFHAISADFFEGLELLLSEVEKSEDLKIDSEHLSFQTEMTPMILAAQNNNYQMLKLLNNKGHRLLKLEDPQDDEDEWEFAKKRRMILSARCQPAYITLECEVGTESNPMTYCLKEMENLQKCKIVEREFCSFYKNLKTRLEDYMCSLLDFVHSYGELASLFNDKRLDSESMHRNQNASSEKEMTGGEFQLLQDAIRENLVKFVTHHQSQTALCHVCFRTPKLLNTKPIEAVYFLSLFFPVLSIIYICAPNTELGDFITHPLVSISCHIVSDLTFVAILLAKILLRPYDASATFSILDWLIMVWIAAKWVQEIDECRNRGLRDYFFDVYNYADISLVFFFTASYFIKFYTLEQNRETAYIPRYMWDTFDPRLIADALMVCGDALVFIRIVGLAKVSRYLGPLMISLVKMLRDVVRFLCIFLLIMLGFGFALTHLYSYYGTAEGSKILCEGDLTKIDENVTEICKDTKIAFSKWLGSTIHQLFWALFGLFDPNDMLLGGKHKFTEYVGKTLIGAYLVIANIIMVNLLIAMMSDSYAATSENEEIAWKFHRTDVWLRFIRQEAVRPLPMNIIPNPWSLRKKIHCNKLEDKNQPKPTPYNKIGKTLVKRYKNEKFL